MINDYSTPQGLVKAFSNADYTIVSRYVCNRGRDLFLVASKKDKVETFYIKFRKTISFDSNNKPVGFFLTFGKQFPEFYEENKQLGYFGESLNKQSLMSALDKGTDRLLFSYADKNIYWIYPKLIKKFGEKYNLIREQIRQPGEPFKETTYSIPFGLLQEFKLKEND